uniref:Peptidase C14 caspase domain-containing protein n=1 Tax=Oryza glumipatula TaxID=40148 RepID=A0A0E0BDW0_9ORYZ
MSGRYEGDWIDGKYDGYGVETWARGSRYRGQYRQGLRHGHGVYRFYTGDVYAGEWSNGQSHGYGVHTCEDGSRYIGEFKRGVKHGLGHYHFRNGDTYAGEYFADRMHGFGVYSFANGHRYEGAWHEGRRQGLGMYTFRNGETQAGHWQNGVLDTLSTQNIIPGSPIAVNHSKVLNAVQEARRAAERAYDVPRVDDKVNRAVASANKAANAARVAAVKAAQKRIPNNGNDLPLSVLPHGAPCIRCAICGAVTHVAAAAPPPAHGDPARGAAGPGAVAPQHQAPGWGPPPPPAHGRKRAVICGISYKFSRHELKGCINDAKCMRHLLTTRFHFPDDSIIMLTEEQTDPYKIPTKHNIRMAMYWLVQGCQPGDSLVFHYSGHGAQQRNYSGDEVDGMDETLCPLDFETQGMIVDDEINTALVRPLTPGVKLHALIDACHSGTALDLPFLCRMNRSGQYVWEDHRPRSGVWKGTSGGECISFSGCDDDQTSADTSALSKITSTGAMTFCFIQAIERGQGTTYGSILTSMRSTIRSTGDSMGSGGGAVTSLITMLLTGGSVSSGGLKQDPQLTANEPFDVYAKPFSL